jgi:hypothetical protein
MSEGDPSADARDETGNLPPDYDAPGQVDYPDPAFDDEEPDEADIETPDDGEPEPDEDEGDDDDDEYEDEDEDEDEQG